MTPEIGSLLLASLRDVVEVQYRMPYAIEPRAREIERWARTVRESQNVLIEMHGFV